jgi:hypothetical protein
MKAIALVVALVAAASPAMAKEETCPPPPPPVVCPAPVPIRYKVIDVIDAVDFAYKIAHGIDIQAVDASAQAWAFFLGEQLALGWEYAGPAFNTNNFVFRSVGQAAP